MKSKTLLTVSSLGLLASAAFPVLAASQLERQLQMTDGYTAPSTAPATGAGVAGRPGPTTITADAVWVEKQLKRTDGYRGSEAIPESRSRTEGRPGKSSDNAM